MKMNRGMIKFDCDKPMEIIEATDDEPVPDLALSEGQRRVFDKISESINAYLKATAELANGKYTHLKELIPAYLDDPGNVLISCGDDGVVVRYERRVEKRRLLCSWRSDSLSDTVRLFSQNLVRCQLPEHRTPVSDQDGFSIQGFSQDLTTGAKTELFAMRFVIDAPIERPQEMPAPPRKPFCLVSARSEFHFHMLAESIDINTNDRQRFVTWTPFRLMAGWDCIEVFPFVDLASWIPENAAFWAEMDILAIVAATQQQDSHFHSLDPLSSARHKFYAELHAFKELLDSNPEREEELHQFLKSHPQLICPSYKRMWSKLKIGAKETDFVFRDATGDYLLVEIERSTHRLFVNSGDPSKELNHACSQIDDWKRYIEDNLSTVQRELELAGISASPRSLVVIGRSASLSPENKRKLKTMVNGAPTRQIMTFDDVYDHVKALLENMFGPLAQVSPNTMVFNIPTPQ